MVSFTYTGNCFITYCLLMEYHFGLSPKFFLVYLFVDSAYLPLSSSRSIQIYPSFPPTPTRRAFTADPLVRLHRDRGRSRQVSKKKVVRSPEPDLVSLDELEPLDKMLPPIQAIVDQMGARLIKEKVTSALHGHVSPHLGKMVLFAIIPCSCVLSDT